MELAIKQSMPACAAMLFASDGTENVKAFLSGQ